MPEETMARDPNVEELTALVNWLLEENRKASEERKKEGEERKKEGEERKKEGEERKKEGEENRKAFDELKEELKLLKTRTAKLELRSSLVRESLDEAILLRSLEALMKHLEAYPQDTNVTYLTVFRLKADSMPPKSSKRRNAVREFNNELEFAQRANSGIKLDRIGEGQSRLGKDQRTSDLFQRAVAAGITQNIDISSTSNESADTSSVFDSFQGDVSSLPGPISEETRIKIQSLINRRGLMKACRDHDAHHTNALRVAKLVYADVLTDEMVCCVKTIWNNLFPNLNWGKYVDEFSSLNETDKTRMEMYILSDLVASK